MQLRSYIAPGKASRQTVNSATVAPGAVNHHGQLVVRRAGRRTDGMEHQNIYVLRCTRDGCGFEYGEEGIRVHQRRCPKCDGGKPALPAPPPEPTLFD